MTDTLDENGSVLSLLVFGVVPRFPAMFFQIPSQNDPMANLASAQVELSPVIAERRVQTALKHNVSHSVENTYTAGDEIIVYPRLEIEFIGPQSVAKVENKIIFAKRKRNLSTIS